MLHGQYVSYNLLTAKGLNQLSRYIPTPAPESIPPPPPPPPPPPFVSVPSLEFPLQPVMEMSSKRQSRFGVTRLCLPALITTQNFLFSFRVTSLEMDMHVATSKIWVKKMHLLRYYNLCFPVLKPEYLRHVKSIPWLLTSWGPFYCHGLVLIQRG